MGWSKKELFKQIISEQIILGILGWIFSMALGYVILKLISSRFFASQGMVLDLNIIIFLGTLIIPLVSFIFIGIYMWSKFKNTDFLEIILGKR